MTTDPPRVHVEPDLKLLARLVGFCQGALEGHAETPALRVTLPTRLYTALGFVDARGRQMELFFKPYAIEVWAAEPAKALCLTRTITRPLSGDDVYTTLCKDIVTHFVTHEHHGFPNL